MNKCYHFCLIGILLPALSAIGFAAAKGSSPAVGIVCLLKGTAERLGASGGKQPLRLYDQLQEKDRITTGAGASLKIAYFSGALFVVGEKATVVIRTDKVEAIQGTAQGAGRINAMASIAPITRDENAGRKMAAFRVRGESTPTIVPDQTELFFPPLDGVRQYTVQIQDEDEQELFSTRTEVPRVAVPSGRLKPGQLYFWSVWIEDGGRKRFLLRWKPLRTLEESNVKAREALQAEYRQQGDVAVLLLLADLDLRLGLCEQARREFLEAAAKLPGNQEIEAARARFRCDE